jgi:hypothetical protein
MPLSDRLATARCDPMSSSRFPTRRQLFEPVHRRVLDTKPRTPARNPLSNEFLRSHSYASEGHDSHDEGHTAAMFGRSAHRAATGDR